MSPEESGHVSSGFSGKVRGRSVVIRSQSDCSHTGAAGDRPGDTGIHMTPTEYGGGMNQTRTLIATLWDRQGLSAVSDDELTHARGEPEPEPVTKTRGESENDVYMTNPRSEPDPDNTRARGDD